MILIDSKTVVNFSSSISYIDAGNPAVYKDTLNFVPCPAEFLMHQLKGFSTLSTVKSGFDIGIEGGEQVVPHLNHWVGRRSNDEFNFTITDLRQII